MDLLLQEWIADILNQRKPLLAIAIRQRAKFEGWLKFELAAYAELQGATSVQVEAPSAASNTSRCRSDLTFSFGGKRYDVELKTPNTNWRLPGILNVTRPITKNIDEIVKDGKKLRTCAGRGIIAFVLFPVVPFSQQWVTYLRRIAMKLDIPLSESDHSTRIAVAHGNGHTAELVICCFAIPPQTGDQCRT
jgi:hypothetical protein